MAPTAKSFPRSALTSLRMNSLGRYGLMTLLALLLFGVILLLSGKNPIQSYQDIFTATLGSAYGFSEVLVAMIPMLITALAVALPARVGLINVGGEGQLYIGAAFATWGALAFQDLPAWILLPLMTLLSMKSIEQRLPATKFMRIHRSFIVNLAKITTIERNRIVLDKEYLPVGDQYKEAFQKFVDDNFMTG